MNDSLLIVIYILLIVLILVAIAIGLKLIVTLTKVNALIDDVTQKVKSLDRVFNFIDVMNDKMSMIGETVIGFVSGGVKSLFKNIKRNKGERKEDDYE